MRLRKGNLRDRLLWKATVVVTWLVTEAVVKAGADVDAEAGTEADAEAGAETDTEAEAESGAEADAEAWRANPSSDVSKVLLVQQARERTYGIAFHGKPP